jgi:cytochrome c-type biogenesis protein CcmH/NrfF
MTVFQDGKQVGSLYPAKWAWHKHESEPPTTEVAIRRTLPEDLYIVLAASEAGTQAASFAIYVNRLVNWVWLGFGLMAIGTGIALLPERTYAFALAKMPELATTTTTALMLLLLLVPAGVSAQHVVVPDIAPVLPRNEIEKRLGEKMVCLCGGCGKEPIGTCTCATAAGVRREIASLVDSGMNEDQVIAHFVEQFGGQQFLGAPIDEGFNRLAWLFPYLLGATGAVAIGFAAVRWSRHHEDRPADIQPAADPALEERLDDELRNLD